METKRINIDGGYVTFRKRIRNGDFTSYRESVAARNQEIVQNGGFENLDPKEYVRIDLEMGSLMLKQCIDHAELDGKTYASEELESFFEEIDSGDYKKLIKEATKKLSGSEEEKKTTGKSKEESSE